MGDRHAPRKNRMPAERKELIKQFIAQNNISSAKDIENSLKDMFKDILQEMLEAEFQRCIVHMIRNTMSYVSYKDKKELTADLKTIYAASNEQEAYSNLQELQEKWLPRHVSLKNWEDNWEHVATFFKFSPAIRKLIYTTNSIESLNNSYKRINKGRRVYPSVQSLEKCMYLATTIITERWTQPYHNWGAIINEFRIFFEDRI